MLLLGVLAYVAVSLDLCDQIAVFSRGGGGIANSLNLLMYDLSTHRHMTRFKNEVRSYCKSRTNLKVVKWG